MEKEELFVYIFFLSIICICIIIGNTQIHENATTLSNQKTEYITELNDDLSDVKLKTDDVKRYLDTITTRNEKTQDMIKNEQKQLEVLKKRQQDAIDEYQILSKKWQNGIYVNPIVQLKFTDDGYSIINTGSSPDNNVPTDKMQFFNVDIDGNPTAIGKWFDFMMFTNNLNNYVSFPVVYMDKFTIMGNISNIEDGVYYTAISLINKRNKNPALHIDVQDKQVIVYSALPSNKPWGSVLRCQRSSMHITYTYNYNISDNYTTVKLYDNGDLVAVENKTGRLMSDSKSYERPDTCIIGRSGDGKPGTGTSARGFFGVISNFKFFAIDLPDDTIKKRMND